MFTRLTGLWFCAVASLFALCGPGCGSDDAGNQHVSAVSGLVLGTVTTDPPSGTGSRTLTVTVRLPEATTAQVKIAFVGTGAVPLPAPTLEDGWLTTRVQLVALARTGDQILVVTGTSDRGPVFATGIYDATNQAPCPGGRVREAGGCAIASAGPLLQLDQVATIADAHGEGDDFSKMQHPRASYRIGNARVGCHSNHIGILADSDLATMDQLVNVPTDREWDVQIITPVVKTFLTDYGLSACEHLLYDASRNVVISSSRGTDNQPGGIGVWALPNLDGASFEGVTLVDSDVGSDGIEGIALQGDVLYAARKPNRLATFRIAADGQLTELADIVIPDMLSAWEVVLDGDTLVMSDPAAHPAAAVAVEGPGGTFHYGHGHAASSGRVFTVDVSDPAAPVARGWINTSGASKGMAVLPEHIIAVANGSAGVELIDVANPISPAGRGLIPTPGTANAVSYHDGYLAVADWDSVRLYDASESGLLRLLDAHDFGGLTQMTPWGPSTQPVPAEEALFQPVIALSNVQLDDTGFVAMDLDHVYVGSYLPGRRGARLVLQDKRRSVRGADASEQTLAIRFSNGGREALWVAVEETEQIVGLGGPVAVAAGESGFVEARLRQLDQGVPVGIMLLSNDAASPRRQVQLLSIEGQYAPGDVAPNFTLPGVNWCDDDGCDAKQRCVGSNAADYDGKPIFLSFFSSW